jgi:murein DD-endopeptidase MepM/ murein hydrolase activator NlpD
VLEGESQELAAIVERAARVEAAARAAASAPTISAPSVSAGAVTGGWTWPASGPVTSEFGYRWGRMHEGIDIGAPVGTPVLAARGGIVSYAGQMSGYGNIVLVEHGGGLTTAYAHQSRIHAAVGQLVTAGQQLGEVGSTGNSTGPHLHFEVRVNGSPRNPREYVG